MANKYIRPSRPSMYSESVSMTCIICGPKHSPWTLSPTFLPPPGYQYFTLKNTLIISIYDYG